MTSAVTSASEAARPSRRDGALFIGLCVLVGVSRWFLRARAPDGPDSLGFVLGMSRRFDIELLQPHFPGYPVYVGLGSALCRLGLSGLAAATLISSVAAAFTAWGLGVCAERLAGPRAREPVVLLYLVAWLPWLLGTGALSDALGSALAVLALAFIARAPAQLGASGFLAGLLLGTRASYWPIVLSLMVLWWIVGSDLRARLRAMAGLVIGVLIWAVPFLSMVGVRAFLALGQTHVRGHFGWWGGSVATESNLGLRLSMFLRDTLFDGFVPAVWALVAIVVVVSVSAIWIRRRGMGSGVPFAYAPLALVLLPYACWVFLAQNVIEQPRHVLPLVEGLLLILGALLARCRTALAAVVVIAASVTLPLAWRHAHLPPAAQQAASWVVQNDNPDTTTVMADRSWRYFAELPGGFTVRKHAWLSEVVGDLSRFPRFPATLWLTTEIDLHSGMGDATPLPRGWEVEPGPQFCRDARIDRAQPCLGLIKLHWNPR